jgi:hypothetical protein
VSQEQKGRPVVGGAPQNNGLSLTSVVVNPAVA